MAKKPKKTTTKKKSSTKKPTRKKRVKKSNFRKNIFIVLGVFLLILFVAFGYFLGQAEVSKPVEIDKVKKSHTTKDILSELSKVKTKKPQEQKKKVEKKLIQKKVVIVAKSVKREKSSTKQPKKSVLAYRGKKPKLVIIIDDISNTNQMRAVQALRLKITPSIFPPFENNMKSYMLTQGLKHYMVHLPMESNNKQLNKQYKTLKTTYTKKQIEERVREIRKLFSRAKYINNHTGSLFTANYKAMNVLYTALRKEGFNFIDSRTTMSTKVKKIAYKFGDAYVARDIFIDNTRTVPYIHRQLRKAVEIAKKKGYGVAIGHPYSVTMKALESAKSIFMDVELVYIDDIYLK